VSDNTSKWRVLCDRGEKDNYDMSDDKTDTVIFSESRKVKTVNLGLTIFRNYELATKSIGDFLTRFEVIERKLQGILSKVTASQHDRRNTERVQLEVHAFQWKER